MFPAPSLGLLGLLVMPNPAQSEVRFITEGLFAQSGELVVWDAFGRVMPRQNIALDGDQTGRFDVTNRHRVCTA